MFEREYQCMICHHFVDHPVDACPVCGDPFYWRVIPAFNLKNAQAIAFLQMMEDLVESNVDRAFLTHGGHLWLPHNFWQYADDGEILDSFAWIKRIDLVQHTNPEKSAHFEAGGAESFPTDEADGEDRPGFDTNPTPMPALKNEAVGVMPDEPLVQRKRARTSAFRFDPAWTAPLAIALFLLTLAFSYFALQAHKNLRAISQVARHEQQILP